MLKQVNKIFVIIPAFNEHVAVREVVQSILNAGHQPVVVDDGSTHKLKETLFDLPVYCLRHRINLGQGAALQTGMNFAMAKGAEYIAHFDADGQHDAKDIDNLYTEALKGYDIVLGSRFLQGAQHNMSSGRKVLLRVARFVNFLFTGLYLSDAHNGIRLMNRKAAQSIQLKENRMAHATELLSLVKKHKLKYKEVPVHILYSDYSRSKGQSAMNSFRILFDLILEKLFR